MMARLLTLYTVSEQWNNDNASHFLAAASPTHHSKSTHNTRGQTSKHQQSPGQSTSQSQSFPKPRLRSQALTHASAARSLSRSSRRKVHVTRERTQSKRITNPDIDAPQEPPHRRGIEFGHTVITQAVTYSLSPHPQASNTRSRSIGKKKENRGEKLKNPNTKHAYWTNFPYLAPI